MNLLLTECRLFCLSNNQSKNTLKVITNLLRVIIIAAPVGSFVTFHLHSAQHYDGNPQMVNMQFPDPSFQRIICPSLLVRCHQRDVAWGGSSKWGNVECTVTWERCSKIIPLAVTSKTAHPTFPVRLGRCGDTYTRFATAASLLIKQLQWMSTHIQKIYDMWRIIPCIVPHIIYWSKSLKETWQPVTTLSKVIAS